MIEKRCFWFVKEMHKQQSEYGYFITAFYGYHNGSIRIPSTKYLVVRLKMRCYEMKAGIEKIISVRELYRMPIKLLKSYVRIVTKEMELEAGLEFNKCKTTQST